MSANPGNVARGLKAAISNPNNSVEAKARAQERLDQLRASGALDTREARNAQVATGHKAAMANPNVSAEAKLRSEQVLYDMEF